MTRAASKKHRARRPGAERLAAKRTLDRGVWSAIILVVAFILLLWFFLAQETFWHALVGAVLAVLGWVNYVAIKAYRGVRLPDWQRPLAKVPLRFAGYGREGGKPLEAAKGQRTARNAVFSFLGISVVIVLLLASAVIPELKWW